LEQLPADEKWRIEGRTTTLILYRINVIMEAEEEELRSFLDRTSSIASEFFKSPQGLSKPVR
jgi:hypothetical protein